MHRCIICMGSNYRRKENMAFAREQLQKCFPSIRFTAEQETAPLVFRNPALFSNQLAVFFTDADEQEVISQLKEMEKSAERCPSDKLYEKICLDIDLLVFDSRVLKPDDLKRAYVVKGLEELK